MRTLFLKGLELCRKYREIVLYLVVGVITTAINGIVYWVGIRCGLSNVLSTTAAWIAAVLFAFFANKLFVFRSMGMSVRLVLREMAQFFGFRLGTYVIDVTIMYVSVDLWGWNGLLMKLVSDFVVTLINFIASKFLIFRKKKSGKGVR